MDRTNDSRFVNIGTESHPVYVPKQALDPDTIEGREWWEMFASGSVTLSDEELDALMERLKT